MDAWMTVFHFRVTRESLEKGKAPKLVEMKPPEKSVFFQKWRIERLKLNDFSTLASPVIHRHLRRHLRKLRMQESIPLYQGSTSETKRRVLVHVLG